MIKKITYPILIMSVCLFSSCGNSYVLSPEQMENLLVDIHLIDGISTQKSGYNTNNSKIDLYETIYKKYDTNKAQFDSSIVYYSENLDEYEEIYDAVLKRINTLEEKVAAGDFTVTKAKLDQERHARIVATDKDILPYINNEFWIKNRKIEFDQSAFDTGIVVSIKADTLDYKNLEIRFNVNAIGIASAACKINVTYNDATADMKNYKIPLQNDSTCILQYSPISTAIENIKLRISATKDTVKESSLILNDCRIYELSPNAHEIKLFN